VARVQYHLRSSGEDRKQLYWGAFMLGGAVFHQHRKAGYWLDRAALEALAARGFALLTGATGDEVPKVDDETLGRIWFRAGFMTGYQERAERMGQDGIELRHQFASLGNTS
jgi:hypothetical protein